MNLVDDMHTTIGLVAGCRFVRRELCCPVCGGEVELSESAMACRNEACCWSSSKFASFGGLAELAVKRG